MFRIERADHSQDDRLSSLVVDGNWSVLAVSSEALRELCGSMPELSTSLQRVIILAGGRSSRMGIPKTNLLFKGETFLERLIRVLSPLGVPIWVLVAEDDQAAHPAVDENRRYQVDYDTELFAGPLVALARHASTHPLSPNAWAFVVGCDTPLIDEHFVRTLWRWGIVGLGEEDVAIGYRIPDSTDEMGMAPFPALYSSRFLAMLPQVIQKGERSLYRVLQPLPKMVVEGKVLLQNLADFAVVDLPPWFNVNTPAEYAALTDCHRAT